MENVELQTAVSIHHAGQKLVVVVLPNPEKKNTVNSETQAYSGLPPR